MNVHKRKYSEKNQAGLGHERPQALAKQALREKLRAMRARLPVEKRYEYSKKIERHLYNLDEVRHATAFFIYVSHASEVETHSIIRWALMDKIVAVPKICASKTMEAHRLTGWEALRPATLGILTPVDSVLYSGSIDVAITPGLGFTLSGNRLGFGRGYYDHWFATHPVKLKVGLAFEAQIVDQMPTDATDIQVDVILTEKRTIRVREAL